MTQADTATRYQQIAKQVAQAAQNAGREPSEVTLVAVSKTRTIEEIIPAVRAGAVLLGENYVQEMQDKHAQMANMDLPCEPQWHFIGHLQRNKVKYIADFCHLVHSIDSVRLLDEFQKRAAQAERIQPVLFQVDIAHEETKFGASENELPEMIETALESTSIDWQGFMTIAPASQDPEDSRPYYARLREIRDNLASQGIAKHHLRHLSMGMTNDFEVAIEEGATLVRVGTAIFGPRTYT